MQKYISIYIVICIIIWLTNCSNNQKNKLKIPNEGKEINPITNDSLLTLVQYQTFQYFWEGAESNSGMARERFHVDGIYPQKDKNVVTTGGTGFGIMTILAGIKRDFISRHDGLKKIQKIVDFLKKADRFHGAWPHWLFGETGKVKPFSEKDNGADIVETAYLVQGLLAARQYFNQETKEEKKIVEDINRLWKEVEWSWFVKEDEKVIYWHWSPEYNWEMNLPVRGYNECLILYVLSVSSPTFPVMPEVYHHGWARDGKIKTVQKKYGYTLSLKHNYAEEYGGPLFWAHYSFLGLDPRNLKDQYADYWEQNKNHTLINRQWCIENPNGYKGYGENCWGLTSSYSFTGYASHAPGEKRDIGIISPTAALSSFPYTPDFSMNTLKHFYYELGDKIWGRFGFYDAFSIDKNWYPQKYLAIDQGPIVVMIENYRSGLLWNLVMSCPEIQNGLEKLGFTF